MMDKNCEGAFNKANKDYIKPMPCFRETGVAEGYYRIMDENHEFLKAKNSYFVGTTSYIHATRFYLEKCEVKEGGYLMRVHKQGPTVFFSQYNWLKSESGGTCDYNNGYYRFHFEERDMTPEEVRTLTKYDEKGGVQKVNINNDKYDSYSSWDKSGDYYAINVGWWSSTFYLIKDDIAY